MINVLLENRDDAESASSVAALEGDAGESPSRPARGGNFYNFLKVLSRMPWEEALRKLDEALARGSDINQLNVKGAGALHAAGFLKRWDLAAALIERGADIHLKNKAGLSFGMMWTREPESVRAEAMASYPALAAIEVGRGARKTPRRRKKSEVGELESTGLVRKKTTERLSKEAMEALKELKVITPNGDLVPSVDAWRQIKDFIEKRDGRALEWMSSTGLHPGFEVDDETLGLVMVRAGEVGMIEHALRGGLISPRVCSQRGETMMERALELGRETVAKMLLDAGADVTEKTSDGKSLLSKHALKGNLAAVEMLLEAGVNPKEMLPNGVSVKEEAEDLGWFEVADALSQAISTYVEKRGPKRTEKRGATSRDKKAKPRAKKSGRGGGGKAGRSKVRMIANLDAPLKEASEWAEPKRKEGPGPIIIVKKAKTMTRPTTGPMPGS